MKNIFMATLLIAAHVSLSGLTNASDAFTIKISKEQAAEEINFWALQMAEHALFLSLGIDNPALKEKAVAIYKNWQNFLKSKNNAQIVALLQELHAFQQEVIKAKGNGKNWIGWIPQAMVEHMDLELTYFKNKLAGIKYSTADELEFWNKEHAQGALATAHLLDPTEKKDTKLGMELAEKFEKNEKKSATHTEQWWIEMTQKYTQELDDYYTTGKKKALAGKQKSVIHPVLRDHEEREVKRSEEVLKRLAIK